ncbi:MAG: hypothetical protein CL942_14780 [Desulfovibrio sp.]|nr:hypothetical protein [Desulfovibrio sp.]MBC18304.1 hypothetical protein [Desulfovibrio sp.]|tara:strand:- start:155 stop:658 length:504 start_codon:yes stop_codon:yes gene_type:complete
MVAEQSPKEYQQKASKRFIRDFVWVAIICGLILAGQGVRYYHNWAQLKQIEDATRDLYVSVLGEDIGGSPFGRLQFEQGKLAANVRIGLDPVSVLASLSRPAVPSLRIETVSLKGMQGRISGFFGPNVGKFDQYMNQLTDDDMYYFTLEKRETVFGGLEFTLLVEPK